MSINIKNMNVCAKTLSLLSPLWVVILNIIFTSAVVIEQLDLQLQAILSKFILEYANEPQKYIITTDKIYQSKFYVCY
jgi:hypothetical protein